MKLFDKNIESVETATFENDDTGVVMMVVVPEGVRGVEIALTSDELLSLYKKSIEG